MKDVHQRVHNMMVQHDLHGRDEVSKENFLWLMQQPETQHLFHEQGVDVVALIEHWDFIFRDKDELPLGEFLQDVLQFRGVNSATVKDIVDMRQYMAEALFA